MVRNGLMNICIVVVQWPRNRGVKGCNCNLRLQKLSHKNAIIHENSDFWGYFATPATLDLGSLRGHYCGVSTLKSMQN